MPSFLRSTLSLAFLVCVIASVTMVFYGIEPNQVTFAVVTSVVSAYLTNYGTAKEPKSNASPIEDIASKESIENVKSSIAKDIKKSK